MLSISKIVAGQARYYLDQARGRVDVVESVGDGVEEYYAGGSEARGQWLGAGAAALDLAGPVEGPALRSVLAAIDPSDDSALRDSAAPVQVAGYDLTYSAPKSVSVLFGIGDAGVRAAVRRGHDRAVQESLAYLERSAAAVRRGHGGARVEPADGFVAAAFRHRTSRAGDPQLHTHVLVANLGRGPDGRWSALDGRRLFAHARTASFIYQAVLRDELSRTLGLEWTPVCKGIAEVLGVPKPILRAFSRRRTEIEAALEERRACGARAAEAAALATRQPKSHALDGSELQASWRERAAEHGFAQEDVHRVLGRESERRVDSLALERAFAAMASPLGLTRRASTFNRRDVIQALCERLPSGLGVDARSLEQAADRFLGSSKVISLMPHADAPATAEVFRRRDGRLLPLAREQLLYSTPELLALEQRLIQRATSLRGTGAGVASTGTVAAAMAVRPTLSPEQRTMIERLCGAGDGVAVVVGRAGSGKTYALGAAREAWQAAGYPVFGVAIARRAARELEDGAGIASTSVSAYLSAVRRGVEKPPDRCVLVVDEAGMLPTRQLGELIDSIERVRGKLVLVGDHRQLPELEAGGAFRGLVHRGLAIELNENRRQVHAWERVALDHLREGRSEQALELYRRHDRVVVQDTPDRARAQLVEDWSRTSDSDRAVMIAHRRDDVAELNLRARQRLRRAGALGADELALPGGGFAVGDRVVVRRNHMRLGVHNGDRAAVVAVDLAHGRLTIESRGARVTLDSGFLYDRTAHGEPTLAHGYAITAHVAQGLTVDHALVFADETSTRELAYTALSRGRQTNRLYVAACPDDPRAEYAPTSPEQTDGLKRLTAALETSSKASLAIDVGMPVAENQRLTQAEAELRTMSGRRRALEARRGSWLPGRRAAIETARRAEAVAAERVAELRNQEAERRHGERPFVSEEDLAARLARSQQRAAERRLARALGRGRGREL